MFLCVHFWDYLWFRPMDTKLRLRLKIHNTSNLGFVLKCQVVKICFLSVHHNLKLACSVSLKTVHKYTAYKSYTKSKLNKIIYTTLWLNWILFSWLETWKIKTNSMWIDDEYVPIESTKQSKVYQTLCKSSCQCERKIETISCVNSHCNLR